MIAKILHGAAFGGLVNYVYDPRKNARIIAASDGVNLSDRQTITDSFVMHSQLSRTKKPVVHLILSFSPHDAAMLDDKKLEKIVRDYLKRMGYDDNQFVAIRHFDKEHPHVHIIVNRVNFQGKCTSDSHEKDRNIVVCKKMTDEYGLYLPNKKNAVKENRLRAMDAIRYHVMHCVMESLQVSNNWKDFQDDLALVGIRCRFRYNKKTNGIEGISFSIAKDKVKGNGRMKHDVSFSGKQLDPSLTLDKICHKLGNPVAIVHEQVRDMYEDARQDWYDSHDGFEVRRINEVFPDFDTRFPTQAKSKMFSAPDLFGDAKALSSSFFTELMEKFDDVSDAGSGFIHAGLSAMAEIMFQPYSPAISAGGGGGSSSKLGWGDDDKYKKKKRNQGVTVGRGRH